MPNAAVTFTEIDGTIHIRFTGYIEKEAAINLTNGLAPLCAAGKRRFLFDFSAADVVNSPAISALLEILVRIDEEFQGSVVICGLSKLMRGVFKMAGLTELATLADSTEDGLAAFNRDTTRKTAQGT